ncbi:hypothetical protein VT84_33535 [Gemmata sp. SH-PL17]|uniref:hypothetical protein n=1 Tax=Gemmata sp. SH-PL17 TaxID=1630693 RepID=UPI00078E88B8|nr:hypothetical protein [Gemmata sp. SH-PL17]AMV29366.1 hypothetical protein VT84_33535 [Gemmata sp. SH-PL17]
MTDELAEALVAVFERLGPYVCSDPHLRDAVHNLGRAISTWADQCAPSPAPHVPARTDLAITPPPVVIPADFSLARPPDPVRPLSLTDDEVHGIVPVDLAVIARRCHLKAEAARVTAARKRGDTTAVPNDLIQQANELPDCDLWMLHPGDYVDAPKAWEDLGGAFAVGAEAATLLAALRDLPDTLAERHRERVLYAGAEAQALMWAGVLDVHRRADNDQVHLFVHIREYARNAHIYINRYLKKEDRVSADQWPALLSRLAVLRDELAEARGKARHREKGLMNLKYKLRKMADVPMNAAGEWPRVLELLEEVVGVGVPASNADIRELLLPVLDTLPEDQEPGPNAERVFSAVNEYLATRPAPAPNAGTEEPAVEIRSVAELLRGRQVVLIGGVERNVARRSIEHAFGLSGLNWVSTRPHESVTVFEPAVARAEVAVVLLAIRWASHSYGDVKGYCEKYGKPMVYLTGGYNPNQIAHQILTQVGDRLRSLERAG